MANNLFRYFSFFLTVVVPDASYALSSINKQEAVEIGGIKQWIGMKGNNDQHPVLLFLHGGPGNSSMRYGDRFTSELQKHFVVVQWDQRESGKTAKLNSSSQPITVALMVSDAVEMINYLRTRFSKEKIYLMGHSWGGFLGLIVAANHPELLEAYFAVSPMVHQVESERLSLELMKMTATETNNLKALNELARITIPFQNGEQLYYHRKWLAKEMLSGVPPKPFVDAWARKWLALFNEASQMNIFVDAAEFKCPVYFLVGTRDYQTNFKLTEEYYKMIKAEKKDLFWFSNSGHNLNLTEPIKLQEIVIAVLMSKN